jgi:uncharacterized protein YwgA
MQIKIELNDEYESKLNYVQQKTDQKDLKAVIEAAIDAYYQQLEVLAEASETTALEIFRESGFIGCIQADPNLSTNYKSVVKSTIQERFNRSQHL